MLDWAALRARVEAAPFRVVNLVPLSEGEAFVTLCDTAGTLEHCRKRAAEFTDQDNRDYDWTLPYLVAAQDDAMRAFEGNAYSRSAIPLNFV